MDWRERCGNKLVSRDVAIMEVRSGFTVSVAPYTTTPYTLCTALMERAKSGSIENVRNRSPRRPLRLDRSRREGRLRAAR